VRGDEVLKLPTFRVFRKLDHRSYERDASTQSRAAAPRVHAGKAGGNKGESPTGSCAVSVGSPVANAKGSAKKTKSTGPYLELDGEEDVS
jgi:hypothetical protein